MFRLFQHVQRLFHLHLYLHRDQGHDQGHNQGHDHDQGHDQGHDHDQGRATLIMTLIMMKHFDKVFVFSGFGSCPWPTATANS